MEFILVVENNYFLKILLNFVMENHKRPVSNYNPTVIFRPPFQNENFTKRTHFMLQLNDKFGINLAGESKNGIQLHCSPKLSCVSEGLFFSIGSNLRNTYLCTISSKICHLT